MSERQKAEKTMHSPCNLLLYSRVYIEIQIQGTLTMHASYVGSVGKKAV